MRPPPLRHRLAPIRAILWLPLLALLLLAACSGPASTSSSANATNATAPDQLVLYACPMNDIPPLPRPGNCPVCGMELTPVVVGETDPAALARSRLDGTQLRLAGVRTAVVERRFVAATIPLFGRVEYDPAFVSEINAFTNGVIDKVYVRRTGEYVRSEQRLLDFYSAEVYDLETQLLDLARYIPNYVASLVGSTPAQLGFVGIEGRRPSPGGEAKAAAKDGNKSGPRASPEGGLSAEDQQALERQRRFGALRFRLRSFGLYDRDINQVLRLEQPAGIISVRMPTLPTSMGGVVVENNATQGAYVNKGTPLLRIADPHFIWARFDAFEQDFAWLRFGQEVIFSSPAWPGEQFVGRVTNLEPVFDAKNRTFRVGVAYNDPHALLRPNASLRGTVRAVLDKDGRPAAPGAPADQAPLVVPASAPLITGSRAVVYVAVADMPGVFEGREVVLGPRAEDGYVVLAGLKAGEMVVSEGAFALDSERQLRARPSMMRPEGLVRPQGWGGRQAPTPDAFSGRGSAGSAPPPPPPAAPDAASPPAHNATLAPDLGAPSQTSPARPGGSPLLGGRGRPQPGRLPSDQPPGAPLEAPPPQDPNLPRAPGHESHQPAGQPGMSPASPLPGRPEQPSHPSSNQPAILPPAAPSPQDPTVPPAPGHGPHQPADQPGMPPASPVPGGLGQLPPPAPQP